MINPYGEVGMDPDGPFALLDYVRRHHHGHLTDCRIGMAFARDVQPDKDGRVWLVKTKKVGDPDREQMELDFIIVLNEPIWTRYDRKQRMGVIDDGLCRCGLVTDREGEVVRDEQDRLCYRTIKPNVVTFSEVLDRHGFFTSVLAEVGRVCRKRLERDEPLWNFAKDGSPVIPFGTVNAKPDHNADDAWKDVKLSEAIPSVGRYLLCFRNAQITTLGELSEFTVKKRLTDINGIGPAAAAKIEAALEQYWSSQSPRVMPDAARKESAN